MGCATWAVVCGSILLPGRVIDPRYGVPSTGNSGVPDAAPSWVSGDILRMQRTAFDAEEERDSVVGETSEVRRSVAINEVHAVGDHAVFDA